MIRSIFITLLFPSFALLARAEKTQLIESEEGWTMEVGGQPFYVKGFTWSCTPVGMKYDYDLFKEDEAVIRAVLERDMEKMRAAGANTLRHIVPMKWMKHIHETYGMHFIANNYCGRYGLEIDGRFVEETNYEDPRTREVIKQAWRELATEYRSAPGLIAHALGNENNYGLEWRSAEAENLPQDEAHRAKARHLYSLFNEIAIEVKRIDPDHPVGIVNGDLQYLDLIAELCPDIDYLTINAYRGKHFSDLFERVAETLDKPVLLMETGCDAYDALARREDQAAQARMIHDNWIDLYRNTAGNGGADNCIGGVAFQWADEWWKRGQNYDLEIHDTEGSWHHPEYPDAEAAQNMNEEWFGVCSIRREAIQGAHLIQPRQAYFALKSLWSHDPYALGASPLRSLTLDTAEIAARAEEAAKEVTTLLPRAEIPYRSTETIPLPAIIYSEGDQPTPWTPSGVMPETNFLSVDPHCTTRPRSGQTCLRLAYRSGGDWSGLVWQHPAGDWENDSPGGYDLREAKTLRLWARGAEGGEKITFSFGGPLTGRYPNTASADFGERTLSKEWQLISVSLEGMDLRRIKNPLTIVMKGTGFPYEVYLDDIGVE